MVSETYPRCRLLATERAKARLFLLFRSITWPLGGGKLREPPPPGLLSGFGVHINRRAVGKWEGPVLGFPLFHGLVAAVGMWESRQRFPRAVGREGNRFVVFLAFHPTVISTALRGLNFEFRDQARRFAIPAISCRFAFCISIAASVSDCVWENLSRSAMLTPGRRGLSH